MEIITIFNEVPILGFEFSKLFANLEKDVTDFTPDLLTTLTVVEAEKLGRRLTFWAIGQFRDFIIGIPMLNWLKRMSVSL